MSIFKAVAVLVVLAMYYASAVTAQSAEAPAPAPSMDKGAAYSLGMSGPIICFSMVLPLLAFLKH
ncbi:hypothetical protein Tsubulata_006199 [Turnera subulata]|uniref:Uncharacterized protein n=1 Tax=Turnera subulata TaxID=218843 RepID=A0A9Q0FC35_9ROSI|nr:hypothetical protein Tsubulata_006199 [Turnera subulata]